jgi:hypothetical protein
MNNPQKERRPTGRRSSKDFGQDKPASVGAFRCGSQTGTLSIILLLEILNAMSEDQIAVASLARLNRIATNFSEILRPFLVSRNLVTAGSKEAVIAFDMLERFHYNVMGMQSMLHEFGYNHNMAVPLSQIFRVMAYDAAVSFWLFGVAGKFSARLLRLNGDFIQKNGKRLSKPDVIDPANPNASDDKKLQLLWQGWSTFAPENFISDANGVLSKVNTGGSVQFTQIIEDVIAESTFLGIKSIGEIYDVLSQQAHFSCFSKPIIYRGYRENIRQFDFIFKTMLLVAMMLLDKTGGAESVVRTVEELAKTEYTKREE